jgi:subtilisin family serine protease
MESFASKLRSSTPFRRLEYLPGLLIVRIKEAVVEHVPTGYRASVASARSVKFPTSVEALFKALARTRQLRQALPLFSKVKGDVVRGAKGALLTQAAFTASVRESENEDLRGINLLKLSTTADLVRIEKDLARTEGIDYAHRVPARWLLSRSKPRSAADPMVNRQWGLRAIEWFTAQPLPDARKIKVAVLDTGIDTTHPDFEGLNIPYTYAGAGAQDIIGHGTHVAGIIAANSDNAVGVAGICRCHLHVWKIFGDEPASDGEYYVDELMYQRALNAARNQGVSVVNLSIGGTARSQTEELLFRRLIESGVVVVAAMGNEFQLGNPIEYPANYPNVIAVGAIEESNRRAPFSNTGKHIALCAPGTNILSTLPMKPSVVRKRETEYGSWDGTSMATPHVSAAAALILAKASGLKPSQVAARLKDHATRLPEMGRRDWTSSLGAGLLNLKNTLR